MHCCEYIYKKGACKGSVCGKVGCASHSSKRIINNKWLIGRRLGKGGYGEVFECRYVNIPLVIKIEPKTNRVAGMYSEIKFYKSNKSKYIPIVYDYGYQGDTCYLVLERLSRMTTLMKKVPDIIIGLGEIAKMGYSHGDVKFENIMQRLNGEVVFVDFGLSYKFVGGRDGAKPTVMGTTLYMGLFAHRGVHTYRNDLESLLFAILHRIQKLPWHSCSSDVTKTAEAKSRFVKRVLDKEPVTMQTYKLNRYPGLYKFATYIFNLSAYQVPDYTVLASNIF